MAKIKNSAPHHNGKVPVVFGDKDKHKEIPSLLRPPPPRIWATKIPIEQPIKLIDKPIEKPLFASDLERLIDKQMIADLTKEELEAARRLIANPIYTDGVCWTCDKLHSEDLGYQTKPEIYDSGYCTYHARKIFKF